MPVKKEIMRIKQAKSSRSYNEKFKIKVVQEITSRLLDLPPKNQTAEKSKKSGQLLNLNIQ